ncbi:MAG: phospholipid carrier-dependent glycosyltransferase [Propionicimonas sp.]|uniref:dolichyl-phosphate-mannose--protein mannosyltransferase n=1 Tax=Propionicimonas sp. TaxID=1955623 RepID=UPI002B1F347A|nr:phospholipid carrier-dependent glycosyltransferase [Propionicimonas sp.]MEA4943461.1 phospholipid carrier-dependent glycosyltransferase [Propionicimonas sp.]MEA5055070.1 phospholipid carrier-dependent glycosyltransferase [Propionicimonas sp.]MEA5119533.1 phospholipid carrier-dependent glycosyltransferase [Propionicimonas sp.]
MTDRLAGWLVTLSITALAFVIRFVNLAYPNKVVFDETYYAKDAYTLWKFGYEKDWPDAATANPDIIAGNPDIYLDKASFIVHPPVGKWLIGFGEHLFGMNTFGWRFMPLVFGTLLVFATIRLTRRLSRSTLLGGIAGLLLTVDGLAFTMSRIALLDIFLAFFLVVAVSCCVADRDWYRWKLADRLEKSGLTDFGGEFGPMIWFRPWRLAAGLAFGLALGSKWNAVWALAVFGLLSVWWDVRARHLAGSSWRGWLAVVVDGIPAFIRLVVVSLVVYVATWTGWLTTSGGWGRDWGQTHPDDPWTMYLGEKWASFLHYHQEILAFHTGEYIKGTTHPYDAHPAGWLVLARPITFDAVNDIQPGVDGCPVGGETCQRVLIALGTPALWWMAAVALLVAIIWWIGGRDWRFGVPVLAALATYVPWFFTTDRPQFHFYAITIVPFTVIALTLVLGLILGPKNGPHRRRGAIIVGVAVALVVANFAWNYPVLTDGLLTKSEWLARMWLRSWI